MSCSSDKLLFITVAITGLLLLVCIHNILGGPSCNNGLYGLAECVPTICPQGHKEVDSACKSTRHVCCSVYTRFLANGETEYVFPSSTFIRPISSSFQNSGSGSFRRQNSGSGSCRKQNKPDKISPNNSNAGKPNNAKKFRLRWCGWRPCRQ